MAVARRRSLRYSRVEGSLEEGREGFVEFEVGERERGGRRGIQGGMGD